MNYQLIMQAALSLAKVAGDNGDVPVGAIVVNEAGEILGTGQNLREKNNDPSAHAEIVAMRQAAEKIGSWRLDDLTMVVTLEPCAMCAGALYWSQMGKVVFAASDQKRGYSIHEKNLLHPKTKIERGILEAEASALVTKFFENLRKNR